MRSAIEKPTPSPSGREGGPRPLRRVMALEPYRQGKSETQSGLEPIKLSSNECAFGPSPLAVEAYRLAAGDLHRYPDGTQRELRRAIAEAHELDPDKIVCGNGSEELIGLVTRAFVGEGDELLLSENHFVMCSVYGTSQGARIVTAPERDFRVDVDELLARVTPRTRMLALANPNNPTGTYLQAAEIRRLVENLPPEIVLLLDGAYAEYVTEPDFDAGAGWVETRENVVMTRTFSKLYGLAGLRIGWAYAPPRILDAVNRLRTPFNASVAAMTAAAAALRDLEHVRRVRDHNREALAALTVALRELGLDVVDSVANFYLVDFARLRHKDAAEAAAFLEARGILPRPAGGDKLLRVTVGTDEENAAVIQALREYVRA